MSVDDVAELLAQPRCLECGTVLRDIRGGYVCEVCGLTFLPTMQP